MTEPRTPDDRPIDAGTDTLPSPPTADPAPPASTGASSADPAGSPTQAWPSLATPPENASATTGADPVVATPGPQSTSPYEPAESLPAARVGAVAASGAPAAAGTPTRGGARLRWGLALVGVVLVAVASYAIVSLVGGRPSTSTAMGYMPATTYSYNEVRLDLPGDQRQKLASFLQAFPGFKDQSAVEPKIDEIFDRIVRAATKDKQTWTADIKPWFGGQVAIGIGAPGGGATSTIEMSGINDSLFAVTVVDRAKAIAWLKATADGASLNQSAYGDADLFTPAADGTWAVAVNDKVMLAGAAVAVKAAVDTGGKGTFDQNDDVKAALATLDKDYVLFGVTRIRAVCRRDGQDVRDQSAGRAREDPDRRDDPRDGSGLAGEHRPVRERRDRRLDRRPVVVDRLREHEPLEPARRARAGQDRLLRRHP